jgi:multiple sugar transport system substrate-binding protein
MLITKKFLTAGLIAILGSVAITAAGATPVTLKYWLWDAAQLPMYQKVADNFTAKNPDIKIEISQLGWNDYWTGIQTGMVAGTATDVITNNSSKSFEFESKNQLVDIAPLLKRDKVDTSVYLNGVDRIWVRQDGKCYGLPKDWDTIGMVYNRDFAKAAGVDESKLGKLTWNPKDGGTFEKFIAQMSLDKNGKNGLDPKFDKKKVDRYGFAHSRFDANGQPSFSALAMSNGWKETDDLYSTNFHFDDQKLIETIEWYKRMIDKGYMAPFSYITPTNGANMVFAAQKVGVVFDGSWMKGFYADQAFPIAFKTLPAGPMGVKSFFNGITDSIWKGSKNQEQAWQWVKYLGSPEAQAVVGTFGVVFPATQPGLDNSIKVFTVKKLDITAFTDEVKTPGITFFGPITANGPKIDDIMTQAWDLIFLSNKAVAPTLKDANKKILALFKK